MYFVFSEISYHAGLPHSPDLLRYRAFAVVHYSCTLDALHLRQMRQLQNLGLMKLNRRFDSRIEPHPFDEEDFRHLSYPLVREILQTGVPVI